MVALSSLPSYTYNEWKWFLRSWFIWMKGVASRSLYDNTAEAVHYRWYKSNTIIKKSKATYHFRDGPEASSSWLCPFERLPGLHTHVAFETIWAPIRPGPSFPHCVCQWARHLSRVKLAVICSAQSALGRWSCSNCARRCPQKNKRRFNLPCSG